MALTQIKPLTHATFCLGTPFVKTWIARPVSATIPGLHSRWGQVR